MIIYVKLSEENMTILSSVILGIIQGLAEFLPISSSGHLVIFKTFLPGLEKLSGDMTFDILLHLGTLIAVFAVYRKTIAGMVIELFKMLAQIFSGKFKFKKANKYQLMDIFVIIATLPLILVIFVNDTIESKMTGLLPVGIMLLVTAGLLFIADHSVQGKKEIRDMTPVQALKIGLFQMIATLPGLSRSGSTIAAGINMGFTRETAVEFSFILGIPAVIGANILNVRDIVKTGIDSSLILPYIIGIVTAAVFGILAVKLVQYVTKKDRFGWFVYYCAIVGAGAVVMSFII